MRSKEAETFISTKDINKVLDKLSEGDRKIAEEALNAAREKMFFHWELEFPEVFYDKGREKEKSGFDAVIGNPPYVQLSMDESVRNTMQAYLLVRFQFSMGRLNTFGFFTKLGLELSRMMGFVSMIIPNTFLTMPYYADFRGYILDRAKIASLLIFDSLPFEEAIVENMVYVFQKTVDLTGIKHNEIEILEAADILKGNYRPVRLIPQEYYHKLFENSFNPYLNPQLINLFQKLRTGTVPLKDLVEINQAIALKHDRAKYLTYEPQGEKYKKVIDGRDIDCYLDGRDIDCYSLRFSGVYLKYDKKAIHSCKREDIFLSKEKLFFRRVGDRIIATLDVEQHYALNTLVVVNSKKPLPYLRFILALLNSSLLNWYFGTFLKSTKDVFSEIQARQIEQLPIPNISFSTPKKDLEKAVNEALDLYNEAKYDGILKWSVYQLSSSQSDTIHDFLSFLAQRIIDMKATEKQSSISVREKIARTDWLIDQIVYKLYGLTDEEIKIVEGREK